MRLFILTLLFSTNAFATVSLDCKAKNLENYPRNPQIEVRQSDDKITMSLTLNYYGYLDTTPYTLTTSKGVVDGKDVDIYSAPETTLTIHTVADASGNVMGHLSTKVTGEVELICRYPVPIAEAPLLQ